MSRFCMATFVVMLVNAGCATERLYVKVVDDDGGPVTNAIVRVGFSTSHVVFGGGHGGSGSGGHAEGRTDNDGNAVVKFNCTASDIGWGVEADGFYRSEVRREHFKGENVIIPPVFGYWKLSEHEKHGKIVLYRKKNPQPMYAYSSSGEDRRVKSPIQNGRYGFDLQLFDWLPPHGNGKVADFYYVRDRPDETNVTVKAKLGHSRFFIFKNGEPGYPKLGDVIGRIEFDEHCGAYIGKQTGCQSFPSVYSADTSREFVRSFPIVVVGNGGYTYWLEEGPAVNAGEYMVVRSRVKCDEQGNVVSANYSKILGTLGLASTVYAEEVVFNPRPNDTNLEFDPERNLYTGKKGRGMIP